jgi:SAM-dependent methyltransferase
MDLAEEFRRQRAWRDWATALAALPALSGKTVLDLGCATGDLAAELAARGARVTGVDAYEDFLREARARAIPGARFLCGDLREPSAAWGVADGIWCSFAAAYLTDLSAALDSWKAHLKPGGFLALTEIDDLFGHEPLGAQARALFAAYAADALVARRYDFVMGRKLESHLERAGYSVALSTTLRDLEFSFDGPALPEVVDAWRSRFARMTLLQSQFGADFEAVRDEFLACLARPDHRSRCTVRFCLATR